MDPTDSLRTQYESLKDIAKKDLTKYFIQDDGSLCINDNLPPQRISETALGVIQNISLSIIQQATLKKRVVLKVCEKIIGFVEKYLPREPFAHKQFGELFLSWARLQENPRKKIELLNRALRLMQYALDNYSNSFTHPDWDVSCQKTLGEIQLELNIPHEAVKNLTAAFQHSADQATEEQLALAFKRVALSPRTTLEESGIHGGFERQCTQLFRALSECQAQGDEETPLLLWNNFLRFSEKSFAMLKMDSREKLCAMLSQAEPLFEKAVENPRCSRIYLRAYLSLLAQKNNFLAASNQSANELLMRNLLRMYAQMRADVEDIKILEQLIKRPELTPKRKITKTLAKKLIERINSVEIPASEIEGLEEKLKNKFYKKGASEESETVICKAIEKKVKKYKKRNHVVTCEYLAKVKVAFQAVLEADLAKHGLTPDDALRIALFVEKGFILGDFPGNAYQIDDEAYVYIKKGEHAELPRSLIIDLTNKNFTVLSKLRGDLKTTARVMAEEKTVYICGGIKKISAAVTVYRGSEAPPSEQKVQVINKEGMKFERKAIKFLREFKGRRGLMGVDLFVEYEKKKEDGLCLMQTFVQDRAAGDVIKLFEQGLSEEYWKVFYAVMEDVAYGLDYMHSKNYIHWDVKAANILYSREKNGSAHGMLNDFDTTFDASDGGQPHWLYPFYGTSDYRAPEITFDDRDAKITADQAKQQDMFALGCVLFDILSAASLQADKMEPIYLKISEKKIGQDFIDNEIAQIESSNTITAENMMLLFAYRLTYPDPARRWNIDTFKKSISSARSRLFPSLWKRATVVSATLKK